MKHIITTFLIIATLLGMPASIEAQTVMDNDVFIFGRDSLPNNGESIRDTFFFFDRNKVAFRGGELTSSDNWSPDELGLTSFGYGHEVEASGDDGATAIGYLTRALGDFGATAMGSSTIASGSSGATALGSSTIASGSLGATAFGYRSEAIGAEAATAMGDATIASGDFGATAMGRTTNATGNSCTVVGLYNDTLVAAGTVVTGTSPIFIVGNGDGGIGNESNAMVVKKNGNVGIGTNNPFQVLDVDGNARFRSVGSGTFSSNLNITGSGVLTTSTSDRRLKENISDLSNPLDKVLSLRGVSFSWREDENKDKRLGFIAQEVEEVVPELVFTNEVDGYKGVRYQEVTALLVEALKTQQSHNERLASEVSLLKSEVSELKFLLETALSISDD